MVVCFTTKLWLSDYMAWFSYQNKWYLPVRPEWKHTQKPIMQHSTSKTTNCSNSNTATTPFPFRKVAVLQLPHVQVKHTQAIWVVLVYLRSIPKSLFQWNPSSSLPHTCMYRRVRAWRCHIPAPPYEPRKSAYSLRLSWRSLCRLITTWSLDWWGKKQDIRHY